MMHDPNDATSDGRGRTGLIALLFATAGAGLGAIAGRMLRARVAPPASFIPATDLLGHGMVRKTAAAGESTALYLRLDHPTIARLDAFAAGQEGAPSRGEAARLLIATALDGGRPAETAEPRFTPGDRVTTNRHGVGVVTDGPIHSTHYAVAFDNPGDPPPPPRVNERGLRPA